MKRKMIWGGGIFAITLVIICLIYWGVSHFSNPKNGQPNTKPIPTASQPKSSQKSEDKIEEKAGEKAGEKGEKKEEDKKNAPYAEYLDIKNISVFCVVLFCFVVPLIALKMLWRQSRRNRQKASAADNDSEGDPAPENSTPSPTPHKWRWRIASGIAGLVIVCWLGLKLLGYYASLGSPNPFLASNTTNNGADGKRSPTSKNGQVVRVVPKEHTLADEDPAFSAMIREKLKNHPDLMAKILFHESHGNQWKRDASRNILVGQPLYGKNNDGSETDNVGIAQISTSAHSEDCKKLDIVNSGPDNVDCALVIYGKEGLGPWLTDARTPAVLAFDIPIRNAGDRISLKVPKVRWSIDFEKTVGVVVDGKDLGAQAEIRVPGKINTFEVYMFQEPVTGHAVYTLP